MSHGLELTDSMFSARETPWHGLGVVVEDVLTAKDAIAASGLGWKVFKEPVYLHGGVVIPEKYATVREDTRTVLGLVGSDYVVLQNEDHFTFADALVDSGEAKYETAGSLHGGKRVFLTMQFPDEVLVGGVDPHRLFLLFTSAHDGSSAVRAAVTPIRVVCQNTLNLGLSEAKSTWSVRHVGTITQKLEQARETLELTFDYATAFQAEAEKLINEEMTNAAFERLVTQLIPDRPQAEDVRATLVGIFAQSPTLETVRGTKWAALNAVGEYYDFLREPKTDESRFGGSLFGIGKSQRQKTLQLLGA